MSVIRFKYEVCGKNKEVSVGLNVFDLVKPVDHSFSQSYFVVHELEDILKTRLQEQVHVSFFHEGVVKTRVCSGQYREGLKFEDCANVSLTRRYQGQLVEKSKLYRNKQMLYMVAGDKEVLFFSLLN